MGLTVIEGHQVTLIETVTYGSYWAMSVHSLPRHCFPFTYAISLYYSVLLVIVSTCIALYLAGGMMFM